ncbi:MAG: HEAT repeat domain-containing protein [Planctomycetota bacterium]
MRLATSLLAFTVLFAPAAIADRDSLEDYLRRAQEARDTERAAVQPAIRADLNGIVEAIREGKDREEERLRERIVDRGAVAALVLADEIETSERASDLENWRADEAAELLCELTLPPLLPVLLERLDEATATARGKLRVIGILGHWPDPEAVLPRLVELSREGRRTERTAAVSALAQLGGAQAAERLSEILTGDEDGDLIELALVEIGAHQRPELTALIGPFLADRDNVVPNIEAVMDFFTSAPDQMTEQRALDLIELVRRRALTGDQATETLERMGRFDLSLRGPVGDALENLERYFSSQIAESALIAMARLGDQPARRRLEDQYTRRIDEAVDEDDFRPYAARAALYLRIDDPRKARKDYRKAVQLDGDWGGRVDADLYVGLARANMRLEDLREASEALVKAKLGPEQLERLASDPDFAPLVESKYGDVFRSPAASR